MKRLITYLLPALLFLTGCSIDEGNNPDAVDGALPGAMTFIVNVPAPATGPGSYALTEPDEERITSFHVFAFDNSGFVEVSAHKGEIKTDETNGLKKSFEVNFGKLKVGEEYNFMVLANVSNLMDNKSFTSGMSKADIIKGFELSDISKWVAASNDIPMWGESGSIALTQGMTIPNVTILRMLAKIDVSVHTDIQNKFKLSSVYLYNYRKGGYVIPDPGNLVNGPLKKVEKPTLLGDRVKSPAVEYLAADGLTATACENIIYTFETDTASNGNKIDLENTHALVIGGLYDTANPEDITYYRVNFYDKDKNKHLDLLRNHSYEVTITGVDGRGYESAQEAFDSKGVEIETTIIPWDNGGEMNVAFNGQYYLSVSKGKWEFDRNAQEGESLYIKTDYVNGWSYTVDLGNSTEEGWLDLLGWTNGDTESTAQLKLLENSSDEERTGYIHIKAGGLTFQVEVTQSASTHVKSINVTPAYSRLYVIGTPTTLKAEVLPSDATDKTVEWSSANEDIATVNAATGVVTTKAAGKVIITATSVCNSTVKGMAEIEVSDGYFPKKHGGWAGSNIYWADNKMTFDNEPVTDHQGYQGLYFKWGALYGTGATATGNTVYKPDGTTDNVEWSSINYVDFGSEKSENNAYLYFNTDPIGPSAERGDICKYLTLQNGGTIYDKKWRMPTLQELKEWENNITYEGASGSREGNETGTAVIPYGLLKEGGNLLPASGLLNPAGNVNGVGKNGYYWSSSSSDKTNGRYLSFAPVELGGINSEVAKRQYGLSVRCVVDIE